jgi:hypothetical protein
MAQPSLSTSLSTRHALANEARRNIQKTTKSHIRNYRHVNDSPDPGLTFRGPFIVMYSYNKTNEMH